MRIVVEHQRTPTGNVVVQVVVPEVASVVALLPDDRRQAIQLLQALLDELPAAVDRALGVDA